MTHLPLKKRLKSYLDKTGVWIHKGQLEKLGIEAGYMGDTVARRLRELAEDKIIDVTEKNGSVLYRSLTPLKKKYIWRINPVSGQKELLKTIYE